MFKAIPITKNTLEIMSALLLVPLDNSGDICPIRASKSIINIAILILFELLIVPLLYTTLFFGKTHTHFSHYYHP